MNFSLDAFFDEEPASPAQKQTSNPETPPWDVEVDLTPGVKKEDVWFAPAGYQRGLIEVEPDDTGEIEVIEPMEHPTEDEVIAEQIRQCEDALAQEIPAWKRTILSNHLTELHNRSLQSIINHEALEFAMYTVEERAIPSLIDGLKPVQRFFMYRALEYAKQNRSKFNKVAALAGGVSEAGYHHGEGSAAGAGQLIANTWNNNIPILEGDGNFGSRMVQQAAAPRYVFCRVHQNFWDIYRDIELAPAHPEPEHLPPRYYLPVIPMVLANGVKGIATGYATNIFPHSYKSLIKCTKAAIEGKPIPRLEVQFPEFSGVIRRVSDKTIEVEGLYELSGQTKLTITELPVKFDRLSYVILLDKLKDQGKIVSYKEQHKNGFRFDVTLKRQDKFGEQLQNNPEATHEKIIKMFGLRQVLTQNITVLNPEGKLAEYECAEDVIRDFVEHRRKFTAERVEYERQKSEHARDLAWAKFKFINMVIDDEITIKGKQKAELVKEIASNPDFKGFENELVGMSIYRMTEDETYKLQDEAIKQGKLYDYWVNTTPEAEYINDLKSLKP
ncbi:DNA topoisomerase [Aeromonas phage SW69-9]|nr:DNA topoisomerase [Aeromonas phage L9-6]APU02540.1 DNA topoisomerase [Aeromonas phage SW69-9]